MTQEEILEEEDLATEEDQFNDWYERQCILEDDLDEFQYDIIELDEPDNLNWYDYDYDVVDSPWD